MAGSGIAEPRSQHVSDSLVQPFLQPNFDAADYLNTAFPSLAVGATSTTRGASTSTRGSAAALTEVSTRIQTLLSQLNAQTTRLSSSLTQLTEEIIRSGGRLAYEVEVLRGETNGLTDLLENGLTEEIAVLVPQRNAATAEEEKGDVNEAVVPADEPEYLQRLRTLATVRARLDAVVKVFGEALQWPIAPSELSLASSLISISAPNGDGEESRSREEKGKAYSEALRTEINELIGSGTDAASFDAALTRIAELNVLAEVWRGTAEERARTRVVESLQKSVEERLKVVDKSGQSRRPAPSPSRGVDYRYGSMDSPRGTAAPGVEGGYGFLQNLRNLKNEVYLD